jgi:hypothetical protein
MGPADHRSEAVTAGLGGGHPVIKDSGMDPGGGDPAQRGTKQDAQPTDAGRAVPDQLSVPAGDEPGVKERSRSARAQRYGHCGADGDGEHGKRNDPECDRWPMSTTGRYRGSGCRRHRAVARE